jgi:hypothetical protein
MSAMTAITRDLGDSHGLALLERLVSTFVTTKFNHLAGRMVIQGLGGGGRAVNDINFGQERLAATIDGLPSGDPRHEHEFEGSESSR